MKTLFVSKRPHRVRQDHGKRAWGTFNYKNSASSFYRFFFSNFKNHHKQVIAHLEKL